MRRSLLAWFRRHGRHFFWREGFEDGSPLTPFQVLLVEFLLWKTSARSAPRIESIARRHPEPSAVLARSREDLEEELRPLGLFRRRASCLLELSRQVRDEHDGGLPAGVEALQELSGIGQYAARATACVLHGSRLMPCDANTRRVFGRLWGEEGPGLRVPGREWDERFDALVPRREPRRFLWAVMDLAAAHCVAGPPRCEGCPLRAQCVSAEPETPATPAPSRSARGASAGSRRASAASRS